MDHINLIRNTLKPHLHWHGARLNFLALFLIALFRVKTVNLSHIATAFSNHAQIDSNYKRLQRFIHDFDFDYFHFARFITELIVIPQPWVLSLDRTEWKFGSHTFNILTLGIIHQGVAFPVLWWMLDKKGNSNTPERIDLIKDFVEVFADKKIAYLTADREFVGEDWLKYLLSQPMIGFRIRIRVNHCLSNGKHSLASGIVFAHLKVGQIELIKKRKKIWGYWVYVGATRLKDNSLLIVISEEYEKNLLNDYGKRWGIETLFGIFKTRGFNLEDTHIQDSERLSRLFALLTIALCWAYKTGEWLSKHKQITIKKHGRKSQSTFRYGFDYIRRIVLNLHQFKKEFLHSLHFLSCT